MTANPDDVALAGELVREAGRLALRMRREGLDVEQKTSVSDVVTAADRAAERLIADRLVAERPEDGLLGEEGTARSGRRTWVIDPVDGTYNFVAGLTWWCSALALVEDGEPVLGAIYHPHDDVLYLGGPELPSTRNGELLAPLGEVPLDHACVTTYLPPDAYTGPTGRALSSAVSGAAAIRMLGSGSLDLAAIAQGQLQAFCQHSVAEWDRLPGEAIVRGAGGVAHHVDAWTVIGTPGAADQIAERLRNTRK